MLDYAPHLPPGSTAVVRWLIIKGGGWSDAFAAKYPGWCLGCAKDIRTGQSIRWRAVRKRKRRAREYRHASMGCLVRSKTTETKS